MPSATHQIRLEWSGECKFGIKIRVYQEKTAKTPTFRLKAPQFAWKPTGRLTELGPIFQQQIKRRVGEVNGCMRDLPTKFGHFWPTPPTMSLCRGLWLDWRWKRSVVALSGTSSAAPLPSPHWPPLLRPR